jgi:tRNA G18 (ribose-2'-O)-methylase SpoU
MKTLSSLKNSHFKRLKKLSNNNFNKKESEFIIEGFKEVKLAIRSNFKISKIYFREEIPLELDLFIREETEIFFF